MTQFSDISVGITFALYPNGTPLVKESTDSSYGANYGTYRFADQRIAPPYLIAQDCEIAVL
jgi:hypothetical protein